MQCWLFLTTSRAMRTRYLSVRSTTKGTSTSTVLRWAIKLRLLKPIPKYRYASLKNDEIHPETLTSYFRSVIVFGTARFVTDPKEKLAVLEKLVDKFAPDYRKEGEAEAHQKLAYVAIIDIAIEHITGKEAIELVEH